MPSWLSRFAHSPARVPGESVPTGPALAFLLILLIAFLVGRNHYAVVQHLGTVGVPLPRSPTSAAEPVRASPTLDALATSTLFGSPRLQEAIPPEPSTTQKTELPQGKLPEAALGASLRGIIFAERAEERRAIVDSGNGLLEDYRIGDSLPGSALIRHIEERRIVIEQDGHFSALSLYDPSGSGLSPAPAPPQSEGTRGADQSPQVPYPQ